MRFVKTTKPILSSVTVKGWSGRSHHPRKSATPVTFVGVDGEGVTHVSTTTPNSTEHKYVLFGVGENQIENPDGLQWREVFEFCYQAYRPRTAFVGFFLGYDFSQIFKTLPENRAYMLLASEGRILRKHRIPGKTPHPVECDGWQFDVLGMKRLRIRPKGCNCENATCKCKHDPWMYICDVGSFFQTSFLSVIDPKGWAPGTEVITPDEYAIIAAGKEKRSSAILDSDMRMYNQLENIILSRVMHTLDVGFHGIGIHLPPSKWFGPGQAAQAWLAKEKVPTRQDLQQVMERRDGKLIVLPGGVPQWFYEAARRSYYGGWFEQFIHGIIPGDSHENDLNSAYPGIIARLPCLLHGTYTRGEGLPNARPSDLCLVYAKVWAPNMPNGNRSQHIGAMLHRDSRGRILRPLATEGWFWWHELQAAQRAGLIKRLDNRGHQKVSRWVKYEPCDCPPPMREVENLYLKRLEVGKNSPLGKAAKLTYNSDYGKFAQSIGDPIYGNPVYASLITAGCRVQILDAIATHPKGKANVAMVATDAVYFLDPHPSLPISDKLGEWEHKVRRNLTLFKPGVYWDDEARDAIASGKSPHFKARGFRAADFVASIDKIDQAFRRWDDGDRTWPSVEFKTAFAMTTALQALRRGKWEQAGAIEYGISLEQNADAHSKRDGLYADEYEGRRIYRSDPHYCMTTDRGKPEWIPSHPYEKRFGMDDPWSEEYKSQLGETPDGKVIDILSWILTGE